MQLFKIDKSVRIHLYHWPRLLAFQVLVGLIFLSAACGSETPTPFPTDPPLSSSRGTSPFSVPESPGPTLEPGPTSTPKGPGPVATDVSGTQPTSTPPLPPPVLLSDVQTTSDRGYEEDVMAAGKRVFLDRKFTFTQVPAALEGQEFLRLANDDKDIASPAFLTFTLKDDAIVYVLYDMRSSALPGWLGGGGWTQEDYYVATDDVYRYVYSKTFPAGKVKLGGNAQPPMTGAQSNYVVVASPLAPRASPRASLNSPVTPLSVEFAVDHVVYNDAMLGEYLDEDSLGQYVLPQDSFMLLSGNNSGKIDTRLLNARAAELKKLYPRVKLYAATSGISNVQAGARGLDNNLFAGLMMVYEPNQENAPEFSWGMAETEQVWTQAADILRRNGLEAWAKPSGRALPGGTYFGEWDHGRLATVVDGQNIQTQGRCRFGQAERALPYLIQQYRDFRATSDLFIQVTVGLDQTHYSGPELAIECAQFGLAYPEVDAVTLWWDPQSVGEVERFLQLRAERLSPKKQDARSGQGG
jgi:hypothetical protein